MTKILAVGDKVILKSFQEAMAGPEDVRNRNNFWLLIGESGIVVDVDDLK